MYFFNEADNCCVFLQYGKKCFISILHMNFVNIVERKKYYILKIKILFRLFILHLKIRINKKRVCNLILN